MPSLAWSTVAVLALLLPGFFFFGGLYSPEGFSRDVAPKNPLANLAAAVLISFTVHAVLTGLVHLTGWSVRWDRVLRAVQLPADQGPSDAASAFAEHPWRVTAYLVLSSLFGVLLGAVVGALVVGVKLWKFKQVFAPFRFLAQHSWVYELNPNGLYQIPYVHILADVGHDGRQVLYRGRLQAFGLAADGAFSYLVVSGAGQRFLRLDHKDHPGGEAPHTGPLRRIGTTSPDPARLFIAGAAIKDVVFQGLELDDISVPDSMVERAATVDAKVDAGEITSQMALEEIRGIMREVISQYLDDDQESALEAAPRE